MPGETGENDGFLDRLAETGPETAQRLLPLVYEELRRLAHARLGNEPKSISLQTTALVNEAYVRLAERASVRWDNRGHFFGAAAEAMRRILIERARRKAAAKHGGGRQKYPLGVVADDMAAPPFNDDILALDDALKKLEQLDALRAQVVKLRYFTGLTIAQTAEMLDVADSTVSDHWKYARAWLYREVVGSSTPDG